MATPATHDTPAPQTMPAMPGATPEQAQAIARREGSLLLTAGAGSGKTSVLVARFVAAVRDDGIAPSRILAITFTERAAGELRARIRARLSQLHERAAVRDLEAAEIGTVHAFCARLLRANAVAAGLDPGFHVLDDPRAAHLRTLAFREALATFVGAAGTSAPAVRVRPGAIDLVAAYGADRLQTAIATVHEELRSRGETAPALPRLAGADGAGAAADAGPPGADAEAAAAWPLLGQLLAGYGEAYERLKRARHALDFDDLELCARDLLVRDAGVREALATRLLVLMVDELQDSNPRQLALLSALERDNLFTVGDELQSIYGFRHADVSLFRNRRARLSAQGSSLALTRSFRAHPALLAVINAVFAPRFADAYTPLAAGRSADGEPAAPLTELLLTDTRGWDGPDAPDVCGSLPPAAAWRAAEARLLAQRLRDLVDEGVARPGEIAVLLRAGGDLPLYERAIAERGLPTLAAGAGGYWSHQQVSDLLAYLRTIANPLDELALYGLLASPLVGVSSDGLVLIARAAGGVRADGHEREERPRVGGAWALLCSRYGDGDGDGESDGRADAELRLSEADEAALTAIWPWIAAERRTAARRSPSQLLVRAIERTGYDDHVCSLRWGERRLANVHKLLRLARAFEQTEGVRLRDFLDHAARQTQAQAREADAPVADGDVDAVRLMTIHAAKGLEFDVVAVADLGRLGRADTPDILVSREQAGLRLVRLKDGTSTPTLDYERLREERLAASDAEESRVMYVAMTRARERLILSGAANLQRWPASRPGAPPISWLGPALIGPVADALSEQEPVRDCHRPDAPEARVRASLSTPATVGRVLRRDEPAEMAPEGHEPAPPGHGLQAPPPDAALPMPLPMPLPKPLPKSPPHPTPRPPILATPLRTLSYTALHEYERCAYRYYLERVLGLPPPGLGTENLLRRAGGGAKPPPRRAMDARTRGSLVHRLLEVAAPFGEGGPPAQLVARVARELGADPEPVELREICDLLASLGATELGLRIAAAPRIVREHPFALPLGADEPLITGVVDAIAYELDGASLIVDYKSDRVRGVDLQELTEREYGVQRRVYALAALRAGAARVDVVHWYLERPHEPATASFGAQLGPDLAAWLRELAGRVRGGEHAVSRRPHRGLCGDCPGRAALCSHDESATLAAPPLA